MYAIQHSNKVQLTTINQFISHAVFLVKRVLISHATEHFVCFLVDELHKYDTLPQDSRTHFGNNYAFYGINGSAEFSPRILLGCWTI